MKWLKANRYANWKRENSSEIVDIELLQHRHMRRKWQCISILLNLDQALARDRATSRAIPGRRIGRADGLDLAFPGHFAKKSSNLGHFAKKKPRHFAKKSSNFGHFAKKPGLFAKKSSNLGHFAKKPLVIFQKSH